MRASPRIRPSAGGGRRYDYSGSSDSNPSWRFRHAEIPPPRSQQVHRLSPVRDGVRLGQLPEFAIAKSRIKVFAFHHEGRSVRHGRCSATKPAHDGFGGGHSARPGHGRERSCSKPRASAARSARSPVPSGRSTTWPRRARCRSATSATARRPAPRPARPAPLPTWTRIGPASGRWRQRGQDRHLPGDGVRRDCHGMDQERPSREPRGRHLHHRAAEHGVGPRLPGPAGPGHQYLVSEVDPKVDPFAPENKLYLRDRTAHGHHGRHGG